VDKKGILSWPNPTAEKVFFLHNNDTNSESSDTSLENVNDINADQGEPQGALSFGHNSPVSAVAEVLDLTHNHNDPFMLHFDDKDWQKFLPNLKPLGLAILLNTCHVDTQVSLQPLSCVGNFFVIAGKILRLLRSYILRSYVQRKFSTCE